MTQPIHLLCPKCSAINRVPEQRLSQGPVCGKCKTHLVNQHPINLTDSTFSHWITKSDLPVIVDFWADWCGPCKMMAPAYSQACATLNEKAIFAKVDTQACQLVAQQYAIRSIPTLIIFKHGKEIARQAGAMSANDIQRWVQQHL